MQSAPSGAPRKRSRTLSFSIRLLAANLLAPVPDHRSRLLICPSALHPEHWTGLLHQTSSVPHPKSKIFVVFSANNFKASSNMGSTFKSRFLRSTGIHSSKTRFHISISCSYAFFKADHLQYEFYLFVVWQFKISLRFLYLYSTTSLNAFRGLFGGASFAAPTATIPVSWLSVPINSISSL